MDHLLSEVKEYSWESVCDLNELRLGGLADTDDKQANIAEGSGMSDDESSKEDNIVYGMWSSEVPTFMLTGVH